MTLDELEAIRLADGHGLYHEAVAERMGVSRATVGRILESARRKVADVLVGGKALRIEGGPVHAAGRRRYRCPWCEHEWEVDVGARQPTACPRCRAAAPSGCRCPGGRRWRGGRGLREGHRGG